MTSEEFIRQQINCGYKVHFNDEVWWQKRAPFFYKPVNFLQKINPGESRPSIFKSFFGYSHLVHEKQYANKYWPVMLLSYEKLREFDISSLPSSKRARVRKGLRLTDIKKIENIDSVIENIKNICISTAMRTRHGLPPEYYVKRFKKWRSWITRLFNLSKGDWWGSFYQGTLIAYIYAFQIDDTMLISAAKSHSNNLDKCPNDALLFSLLNYCKNLHDCKKVIFGDWSKDAQSLNEFKMKFGFKKKDLPLYVRYNPAVSLIKKIR